MNRYQLYLNPNSVMILDELQSITDISRSKILRKIIDNVAEEYGKLLSLLKKPVSNYRYLDKMCGFIKLKKGKKTNYAQTFEDELYSRENL